MSPGLGRMSDESRLGPLGSHDNRLDKYRAPTIREGVSDLFRLKWPRKRLVSKGINTMCIENGWPI